jgi:hypothetical protein
MEIYSTRWWWRFISPFGETYVIGELLMEALLDLINKCYAISPKCNQINK